MIFSATVFVAWNFFLGIYLQLATNTLIKWYDQAICVTFAIQCQENQNGSTNIHPAHRKLINESIN